MCISEDEYDRQLGGAIELSTEDGAKLDALSTTDFGLHEPIPHINVEWETPQTSKTPRVEPFKANSTSPFKRYRQRGYLSVTDLVAPTWCEVQFEYGLQQHRSRKLDKRPESFITREGKEIRVEREKAQLNDTVLREGHAIHTALEREIHPTQVIINTNTPEEEWGLRLINMLSDVQTLMLIGKCREFPVMGTIYGHLVIGIVDEVIRVPLADEALDAKSGKILRDNSAPSTPHKQKSMRSDSADVSSSAKQLKISSFFPVTPKKIEDTSTLNDDEANVSRRKTKVEAGCSKLSDKLKRTHTLYLVDSKTRLSRSLPQHSSTLSSRLQLMVYKRLLDALLSSTALFDFDSIWEQVGVDPQRRFSDTFLEEASLLNASHESEAWCLKDLESKWRTAVHYLGVNGWEGREEAEGSPPVDDQLTLVYRLRAAGPSERQNSTRRTRCLPMLSSEDEDLQRALQESLQYTLHTENERSETQNSAFMGKAAQTPGIRDQSAVATMDKYVHASKNSIPGEVLDFPLEWAIRESLREAANILPTSHDEVEADPPNGQVSSKPSNRFQSGTVIGTKQFKHSDAMLDTHITDVLQWWHGEREPRGVAVEDTSRCHTCEYMSGCEWREKKASEHWNNEVERD